jgi:uncharacterized membrane protein YhaH (DUF805 family)
LLGSPVVNRKQRFAVKAKRNDIGKLVLLRWGYRMQEAWYYAQNGQAKGPLTLEHLGAHLISLRDAEGLLVWQPGFEGWKEAQELSQLQEFIARPPPVPPRTEIRPTETPVTSLATALFSFSGRIDRADYVTILILSIVGFPIAALLGCGIIGGIIVSIIGDEGAGIIRGLIGDERINTVVLVICVAVPLWAMLATGCKRFHDFNRSGYNCALLIVPVVHLFLLFFLIFKRGDSDANAYGPPLRYF